MEKSQEKLRKEIVKIPDSPGIYKFLDGKNQILYIGKATSLRNRIKSYFALNIEEKRSPLIAKMVGEAVNIKFEKTDSVLEALILEAELIKKHLPPYNSAGKDQRSWNYVVITKEKFPRVLLMREREITPKPKYKFGPFTNGGQLKEALKIIRKIFPFRDKCKLPKYSGGGCFDYQIGLCPGVCVRAISEKDYKRTIGHIVKFFQGKKQNIIRELKKEMKDLAKEKKFEEAGKMKNQIFALKHIEDIALIKNPKFEARNSSKFRIEAYDVAHISGTNMVGVMVVIEDGEVKKSDYRMFKIQEQNRGDDIRALKEILERRLNHKEWSVPNLVVVDGGISQLNVASSIIKDASIVAVTKDKRHKPVKIQNRKSKIGNLIEKYEKEILLANSEAHRFAIKFHRKLRNTLF